ESDLAPIQDLAAQQPHACRGTQVSDLAPIQGLAALQHLECGYTRVSDLAPIQGLAALQHLDCRRTQVSDLAPIQGLAALQHLNCSFCHLNDVQLAVWMKPSLQTLHLSGARVPGVPDEILGRDCLDRLRAHLKDLEAGAERMRDVKLLILGNGSSGKTQIAGRLSGLKFDPAWDSTHGIKVSQTTLPAQDGTAGTTLHLWDFGGQDIYHGTHALFVRSRALFLIVWCADTERPESQPDPHGMVFRNHPLPYWLDYVRHLGDRASPVVVAQAQVDRTGVRPAPDPDGLIAQLGATHVATSAADPPRLGALTGALQDAVAALDQQRGAVSIGKGRVAVQRRIEALRRPDGTLPHEYRTISQATFRDWCQEAGGVSSPEHLLAYLHSVGTLFYQKGLFHDQIVLDHAWALDAIYAVFDRSGPYKRLTAHGGRFDRADLATVWRKYTDDEQRLFLGMMRSCGICFVYRGRHYGPEDDDDTIYLAPDLLPDRADIQVRIDATWGEGPASHRQTFAYPFLHHGLIRGVIAHLGELGGDAADYFRGGVCLYDATTRARALIQQQMEPDHWRGRITIETRDGQAEALLDRLAALIAAENDRLGLKPTTDRATPPRATPEPPPIAPARPASDANAYAVSYAWNNAVPGGPDRESKVDALCEAAEARGEHVLRDKTDMGRGDRIDKFTDRIGRAGRVFVFLSDKYLRSDPCMQELAVLWTQSRAEEAAFRERVLFYFLDVDLADGATRDTYLDHWETRVRSNETRRARMGPDELKMHTLMSRFLPDLPNVLYALGNTIRHQDFDAFLRDGFPKRGA
ncbi:MAG: COR domain-containing protein, partial [Acetobacteraceae bacterium]